MWLLLGVEFPLNAVESLFGVACHVSFFLSFSKAAITFAVATA